MTLVPEIFGRVLLVLGAVDHLSLVVPFCIIFVYMGGFSPRNTYDKLSYCQVLFLDRSVYLKCLCRRRCSHLFFSLCLSPQIERKISGSNRSHAHLPPARVWSFFSVLFFIPMAAVSVSGPALFAARPFFSGGCFCPQAFLGFSVYSCPRACSCLWSSFLDAVGVWVFSFLCCFCFPVCGVHFFLDGPRVISLTSWMISPAPWEE